MKIWLYYRLPVIGYCTLIFWQSSFPGVVSAPLFPHMDKALHFAAYAVLAMLSVRALKNDRAGWPEAKILFAAALFSAFYGLSDEIHQAFVPQRCASAWDFMADTLGAFCGAWAVIKLSREKNKTFK